jgi:flagellar hook-associated protein 3 FlgL
MRVTDRLRFNSGRADMNRLRSKSADLNKQITSGNRINKPSDDPFGALQAAGLDTHKRLIAQYARNIDSAKIQLSATDNALGQAVDAITSARTITLGVLSATGDARSRSVMADNINQIKDQLFNLANTRVGDTYLFGGFQNTKPPYVKNATTGQVSFIGDEGKMQLEIGEKLKIDTTLKGGSAFGGFAGAANQDIFDLFTRLENTMRSMDNLNPLQGALSNPPVNILATDPVNLDVSGNQILTQVQLDQLTTVAQNVRQSFISQAGVPVTGETNPNVIDFEVNKAVKDLFQTFQAQKVDSLLGELDGALNQVSDLQSLVGMKQVNVDNAESTNSFLDGQVQTTLAGYREADAIKVISDMSLVENAFQAAVNTTSRVLQGTSLLDFLR